MLEDMLNKDEGKSMEEIAEADYNSKLNMKKKEEEYYQQKMQELGLKPVDRLLKYLPEASKYMKKGITFAHQDFEVIAKALANNEPFAVISGLSPTGPLHFGHKVVFDELLWLQKLGADVFIPITNDEAYVVGKSKSLAESRKCAYEEVIPSIIAFGFKSEKTKIFVDSDYKDIYNVAMDFSKNITNSKIKGVFGEENLNNPGVFFYRGAVQLAQILLPQLKEFGGPKPTIIPVGIDQYPYILVSRDIAEKRNLIPPASIYIKFLNSLKGPENKMSASDPSSCIYLTDNPKDAERKIRDAFTGGSPFASIQREKGGIPEVCSVHSLLNYHFYDDKEAQSAYKSCREGKILCSECKKNATSLVTNYLIEHQEKMKKAKKNIKSFLLDTPINSIL